MMPMAWLSSLKSAFYRTVRVTSFDAMMAHALGRPQSAAEPLKPTWQSDPRVMKTFGLIVRNGTGRIFDPNVRELLEKQTTLVQIILPLLDAWRDLRKRAAILERQLIAEGAAEPGYKDALYLPSPVSWDAGLQIWPRGAIEGRQRDIAAYLPAQSGISEHELLQKLIRRLQAARRRMRLATIGAAGGPTKIPTMVAMIPPDRRCRVGRCCSARPRLAVASCNPPLSRFWFTLPALF